MKLRVQQSDMWVTLIQSMGGNPTPLPYAEVYTALKTGVVDGAENNWPSYESSRHYEVAKNYSLTEHSMSPELLVFSKVVWDTLGQGRAGHDPRRPPRNRCPICASCGTSAKPRPAPTVEAGGATIISDIDRQGFVDAAKPVYDKFAADPKLQDLIKQIQATE